MKTCLLLATACVAPASALTIKIDYTYDSTNFFNTQAKKDAIEAVAKFYGGMIQESLLRIDAAEFPGCSWTAKPLNPTTGATVDIPNLVVPADTIIVYVGARDLGGSTLGLAGPGGFSGSSSNANWFPLLRGRGNAGAATSTASLKTDFAPWGGSIAFDIDSTWNFSQTVNQSGAEFISVALHEMGHVLGIGTADSWFNKVSSSLFTGTACVRSNGSSPPVQSGNGHFDGSTLTSKSYGSFNVVHGTVRQALMLAALSDDGTSFVVASDLDLAALIDIGWNVSPPMNLKQISLKPSSVSFSWPSTSFFDYKLQRGTTPAAMTAGSSTLAGNGTTQSWIDPSPPSGKAFYRLARTVVFSPPQNIPAPSLAPDGDFETTAEEAPRVVFGCSH